MNLIDLVAEIIDFQIQKNGCQLELCYQAYDCNNCIYESIPLHNILRDKKLADE